MFTTTHSATHLGMDGYPIRVEVDISSGLPVFQIVGLPDAAVKEAKDRVRAAIKNSGFEFPLARVTVNLSPADTRKVGPAFDLPIAIGILAATGQIEAPLAARCCLIGELSLDGLLRPVSGVLPAAECARRRGYGYLLTPTANAAEAGLIEGIRIAPCRGLLDAVSVLAGTPPPDVVAESSPETVAFPTEDFVDIKGQEAAKRALEVAAAGMHNLLMVGPPGSGKTMLARRLTGILPALTRQESINLTKLYSIAGLLNGRSLITARPFRSPHHTVSSVGLVGGGSGMPLPGEISLSNDGVLFLDELPEFGRRSLEVLRQPMEDGFVSISRSLTSVTYPARFVLLGAMNPCPCGYHGDSRRRCTCRPDLVRRYADRLSGPLLDRIDIRLTVPRLSKRELMSRQPGSGSAEMRQRVAAAHKRQLDRYSGDGPWHNAGLPVSQLRRLAAAMSDEAAGFLGEAIERLDLSARAYDRSLRLALTIADLDGSDSIELRHVAESIQYRGMDRPNGG